jgi:hypothetical protein
MILVRRSTLAVVLTLVTIASGAIGIFVPEPCASNEPIRSHAVCPPTCVTCGCCSQSVEAAVVPVPNSSDALLDEAVESLRQLPNAAARDILHVPKLRLA